MFGGRSLSAGLERLKSTRRRPVNFFYLSILSLSLWWVVSCEGPEGPVGPVGPQGFSGLDIRVETLTGTVRNGNYTEANIRYASIPLGGFSNEPAVLFFGVENANGVFVNTGFSSVIWGGSDTDYTVPGTRGWYMLILDSQKLLIEKKYQVKLIR